jgi:hypothetical protein
MADRHLKLIGIICMVVGLLCAVWVMIEMTYTIPGETHQYRFDGVYASNGTVLMVKTGKLVLIGGTGFAVDHPLRRMVDLGLWGMCFVMTVVSGIVLLRLSKRKQVVVADAAKPGDNRFVGKDMNL